MKTLMLWSFVLLPTLVMGDTHESTCIYEDNCECSSPGHTIRWEFAYCDHILKDVDMEEQYDEVLACVNKAKPENYEKLTSCKKNEHWRGLICDLKKEDFKSQSECMANMASIPDFVEHGFGE